MAKLPHHFKPLPTLADEQALASQPVRNAWLSASAGTGKTQVLSARVLRLLLHGARPEAILCLTFTKAGAAEMAERIHARLGDWVRLPGVDLARDLMALGEDHGPEAQQRARSLFASVLDARGGGLRIMTIHSFCQSLLGGFPAEAGLVPGFRPIEGREEAALAQSALADMVVTAEREGRLGLVERLKVLAHERGEDGARRMLQRCAAVPDVMALLGSGIEAKVRSWLKLHSASPEDMLAELCADSGFDRISLEEMRDANLSWGTATGIKAAQAIGDWLALDEDVRVEQIDMLVNVWTKQDGDLRSVAAGLIKVCPDYDGIVNRLFGTFNVTLDLCRLARTADSIANALIVGQEYARTYAAAKRAAGVVDFNDMIRATVNLLATEGMGDWIRYKLDQATDHILVDEAQDTNANQWSIVKALAEEFFAGEGAKPDVRRTIFTVGDFKQAIFGFQGTDPKEFASAKSYFAREAANAGRGFLDLSLSKSFRSSQPVLDVVDAVIDSVSSDSMGLDSRDPAHLSANGGSGAVTLWAPVTGVTGGGDDDEAEEDWLTDAELAFADGLAKRVKHWTNGGLTLRNLGRAANAGDVLILVRSRGDMARLIVSRLIEEGVDVAGVDRLHLNAPIAVQDMLSCIRFVLQPNDDLNLAALLVSPLIGWSQDDLYERAKGRKSVSLWQHLGPHKPADLSTLLGMADLTTPHRFLQSILSGPMDGRRKFIARLGEEARDPVEELLNAALAFEAEETPSLQQFVAWFDRGDVDIKRDPSGQGDAVRVMTVHGAKGLQAPIVVLADATSDPDFKRSSDLDWQVEDGLILPVFRPRKEDLVASLKASAEASDARELQEHWRLLYVALTRAEEYLFIGGAMKPRQQKNGLGPNCWHSRIAVALAGLPVETLDTGDVRYSVEEDVRKGRKQDVSDTAPVMVPDWARRAPPAEARPPRPLAPSAIEPPDTVSNPPPSPAQRVAAERGILLHGLFERLPALPIEQRREAASRWLGRSAPEMPETNRLCLAEDALSVLDDPAFAEIFAPDALAEAPLAGVVNGQVIAGTVDRLIVRADRVLVVDFKTGRRVPHDASDVPPHHLAQMAAYAAVLAGVFPDHRVEAALLYTSAPKLIRLSADDLDRYKPAFLG
jgi:ATP-dependent helicase/nuclease subunit A